MINTKHYDENAPIRIYVANLGKYNEGELVGSWISLPIDEDELNEILEKEVGLTLDSHEAFLRGQAGERVYEEWAIHDWESEFFSDISEWASISQLNEKAEIIDGWNDYEKRTMLAAIEEFGDEAWLYDADDFVLYDEIESDEDMGHWWAHDSGCYDLDSMSELADFIDYEKFGNYIANGMTGGYTKYGFIELRR